MTFRALRYISSTCLTAFFVLLSSSAAGASEWRHFRGPSFDGSAPAEWPEEATLRVAWKTPLGNGYSGIVVADGRAFTSFADDGSDWLGAFDLADGEELWRLRLGDDLPPVAGGHGGPSATPVAVEGLVIAVGGYGTLVAARFDGEEVWRRGLKEWGDPSPFGFASSPVVVTGEEGAVLVLQVPGRDGTFVVGLDATTGEDLWSRDEDVSWYQTPVVAELAGRKQIVVSGTSGLHGVTPRGELLWTYDYQAEGPSSPKGRQSNVPLPLGHDRFLVRLSAEEVAVVEVASPADCDRAADACGVSVRELWRDRSIARTYAPPVHRDGVVYGFRGSVLVAFEAATGRRLAISRRPGDGFLVAAADRLLIVAKRGSLHLGRLGDSWDEEASVQLFEDASWTEPTVAGGAVFLRSMGEIARVDVVASDRSTHESAWIDESLPGAELPDTRFGRLVRSLESVSDRGAVIDRFLAGEESFPIIEGEWAHFVVRSEGQSVGIAGDMVGERAQLDMIQVPETDLFYFSSKLPRDARVSYLYFTQESEDGIVDPLNPRVTVLPREGTDIDRPARHYSWFTMPGVSVPGYRSSEPPPSGRLLSHRIDLSGLDVDLQVPPPMRLLGGDTSYDEQRIRVYLPASYDPDRSEPYPLVLVFGGDKTLEGLDAKSTLDHLLGDELPAAVVVFVDRHFEFLESDASWSFELHRRSLFELILPLLRQTYHVAEDPYYLGFGYAGPIVVRTIQAPESTARRVAAIQPFLLNITRLRLVAGLGQVPPERQSRVYLETSRIDLRAAYEDWNVAHEHQKLMQDFQAAGWEQVELVTTSSGFFWDAWTDRLAPGLAFLLTGKAEVPDSSATE